MSSVNWIYYKFGPYAFELETAIREIAGRDIEEFEGISPRGHEYFTYQPTESIETAVLTPEEKALVSSVVERWAGEAIESLLNYAYFDTEPMQDAVWGEPLDFSLVSKRVAPISLQEIVLMTGGKAAI